MWTKIPSNTAALAAEIAIMALADSDHVLRYTAYDDFVILSPRYCGAKEIIEDGREVPISAVFGLFRGINHLHGLAHAHNAVTVDHLLVKPDGTGVLCGLSNVTLGTQVLYAEDMYNAGVVAAQVITRQSGLPGHTFADMDLDLVRQLVALAGDTADTQTHALVSVLHGCFRADPTERITSRDAVVMLGFRPLN